MASREHVEQLKRSIQEWNIWRQNHPETQPDLSNADLNSTNLNYANLSYADLSSANLSEADINGANLSNADLDRAHLSNADLNRANLSNADLSSAYLLSTRLTNANLSSVYLTYADLRNSNLDNANLSYADLSSANLSGAKLISAKLISADLSNADLSNADLSNADLNDANLRNVHLKGTQFEQTRFGYTLFAWIDLSTVKGLEKARHDGPSCIDINSVILPYDEPTRFHFWYGVGFTETQIEYLPSLLTPRPIQYHSLFISYASQDEIIAQQLYTDLHKKDVPCWFAPHNLEPGDDFREEIDKAIHIQEKLLLILSKDSMISRWVKHEVNRALNREIEQDCKILYPIRLDDTVLSSTSGWAADLRAHRHIGDFTNWRDETTYQEAFAMLLRHLKVTRLPD